MTTAAAGGFLGGAGGTVAGAAVASVVTTVGEAIYQRSLERTRERVRSRIDARRTRAGGSGATAALGQDRSADATRAAASPAGTRVLRAGEPGDPGPDESPTVALTPTTGRAARAGRRKRVAVLVATGVLIFLIAMVVVTGIERVKGSPLSGGQGTSIGEVFGTGPTTTTTSAPDDDGTTSARSGASEEPTSTRVTTTTRKPVTTTRSRAGVPETTLVTPTP